MNIVLCASNGTTHFLQMRFRGRAQSPPLPCPPTA
jgi:hypothetical protein